MSRCAECFENEKKNAFLLSQLENLRSKEHNLISKNEELSAKYNKLQSEHIAMQSEYNNVRSELMSLRSEHRDAQSECEQSRSIEVSDQLHDEREYEIEAIIGHKKNKGKWLFKVHWKGYDIKKSTWEKRENVNHLSKFKAYLKNQNMK